MPVADILLLTCLFFFSLSFASFSWRCLVWCCISSRPPRLPGLTQGASCLGHPLSLTRDVTRSSSSSSSRPRLEQGEVSVRLVTHRCFLAFSASRWTRRPSSAPTWLNMADHDDMDSVEGRRESVVVINVFFLLCFFLLPFFFLPCNLRVRLHWYSAFIIAVFCVCFFLSHLFVSFVLFSICLILCNRQRHLASVCVCVCFVLCMSIQTLFQLRLVADCDVHNQNVFSGTCSVVCPFICMYRNAWFEKRVYLSVESVRRASINVV